MEDDEEYDGDFNEGEPPDAAQSGGRQGNAGRFASAWDAINLEEEMRINVPTLEYIPKVIRGPFLQLYG